MDATRRADECVHLQLSFGEFNTVVCERNLEKLVLSNENDMVVLGRVELACDICWFGRVAGGMKAIRMLSIRVAGGCRVTGTYSHLYEDMARGAPLIFSGSRDPLDGMLT